MAAAGVGSRGRLIGWRSMRGSEAGVSGCRRAVLVENGVHRGPGLNGEEWVAPLPRGRRPLCGGGLRADNADRVMAVLFVRLDSGCIDRAVWTLRSADVGKADGMAGWSTFLESAEALLDGRALETVSIMGYVSEGANRELAIEAPGGDFH